MGDLGKKDLHADHLNVGCQYCLIREALGKAFDAAVAVCNMPSKNSKLALWIFGRFKVSPAGGGIAWIKCALKGGGLSHGPRARGPCVLAAAQAGDDGHARRSHSGKQTAGQADC
jgi:hypothetical protein